MSSKKALKILIDDEEKLRRILKQHDWAEGPRDPKALTNKILNRIETLSVETERVPSQWQSVLAWFKHALQPSQLGWGAAAAVLVMALVFRWQWVKTHSTLEALLTDQANEKVLYQVAKITLQQAQDQSEAKVQLSELLMGEGEFDVISVIEERGADSVGSQLMHLPTKPKQK